MKNLFNLSKDISYFKEFWREIREGVKKVPLVNLLIRMFLVVFKWGIIAAAIVFLALFIIYIIYGIKYGSQEKKPEEVYHTPEKITKKAETFNIGEEIKIDNFPMTIDSLENIPEVVKEYVYKLEMGRKEILEKGIELVRMNFTLRNDSNTERDFDSFGFKMKLESNKISKERVKLVWRGESGLQAAEWEEQYKLHCDELSSTEENFLPKKSKTFCEIFEVPLGAETLHLLIYKDIFGDIVSNKEGPDIIVNLK
jgi:Ca2+/Na+ antiporter